MSRCYALTAKGRPCRQYATIEERTEEVILYSPTCAKHTGTFNGSWWKVAYLAGTEAKGKYLEYSSVRRHHVERVLRDGVVTLERHEIASIPALARWTAFFHIAARYTPGFCMSWNPELWSVAAKTLWRWWYSVGPMYIPITSLISIARNETSLLVPFYALLLTYPHTTPIEYHYTTEQWRHFFTLYLLSLEEQGEERFLLDEQHTVQQESLVKELKRIRPSPPFLLYLEEGILNNWLYDTKQALLERKQRTTRVVKEELVASTWAPERVIGWCLDDEEKQGILGRWPATPYTSSPA